jgi:hypothetical protein
VADPRPTLQGFLGIAPIIAGLAGRLSLDVDLGAGFIPHSAEVNQHLFPNVMWCRDDGKTMRYESRDSLWLPLEFLGSELLGLYSLAAGF